MTTQQPATSKFIRKPFIVEAVQATGSNLEQLRAWCGGTIGVTGEDDVRPGRAFVKVANKGARNERQTRLFPGDWLLKIDDGFRLYTRRAFEATFDPYNDAFEGLQTAFQKYQAGENADTGEVAEPDKYEGRCDDTTDADEAGENIVLGPEYFAESDKTD